VSLASLGHRYSPRLPEFLLQHAHYEPRLEPGGHRRAPGLERWGRSSSVPERSERFAYDLGEPGIHLGGQLTGSYCSRDYPLVASDCAQRPSHGGSYLLRQRAPLSHLGRQFSISSDYVADSSLYEPSYNYPSFHGISDSLRATIGVNSDLHRPGHQYIHSDYRTLQTRPPNRDREAVLYPERRKKTVRFDSVSDEFNESGNESWENGWMTIQDLRAGRWGPGHGHQPIWPDQRQPVTGIPGISSHRSHGIIWDRQESQDSTARDSGIDTSSCFTSSEDSNRDRDCQPRKVGGTWQPTADGTRLVGRMVLKKVGHADYRDTQAGSSSSATLLGLKIVGGKLVNGRYGAIIEKVKQGSVADLAGHLLPGDEVLEWNGRSLQSRSYEEVRDIIAASRQDRTIELVVSRDSDMGRRLGRSDPLLGDDLSRPSLLQIEDQRAARSRSPPRNLGCRLQVKTWYDRTRLEMIVTVLSAVDLPPRTGGQYRNPYAKLFLLPDRSERSKRRTKTLANTNHPRWNQSFVYAPVKRSELRSRVLEVTVWDYDRFGANEFLGEVTIDLAQSPLDEEAEWHYLTTYKNGLPEHLKHSFFKEGDMPPPPNSRFSPPIVASRYSESPVSDFEDGYSLYRDRLEQVEAKTNPFF